MEFEDTIVIDGTKSQLWELVSDPEVLANCVPGAKEVTRVSESEYTGTIERGLAGITLALDGDVEMTELNPPDVVRAKATGEDSRTKSRLDADAMMEMTENGGHQTELHYTIDLDFTGKVANLGSRIVKRKIHSDIETFFDNVKARAEG